MRHTRGAQIVWPLALSLALHASAVAALFFTRASAHGVESQPYMVRLDPAPEGPPEMGLVTKAAVKEAPKPPPQKTAPVRSKTPDVVKVPTAKKTKAQTPAKQTVTSDPVKSVKANIANPSDTKSTKAAAAPTVAGSISGGKGADAANALFHGIEFSDQRYLDNIVNRIAHFFSPLGTYALIAEFEFDINRDGCMTKPKLVKGSGISDFDVEARVAIEKAGENCAFNPLPASWTDDILNIRFRFDPKLIKK